MTENISLDKLKELNKRIVKEYDGDYPVMTYIVGLYPSNSGGYDMASVASSIDGLQEICNTLYETHGVQDTILELQTEINKLRYEFDITDQREILYSDADGEFVQ